MTDEERDELWFIHHDENAKSYLRSKGVPMRDDGVPFAVARLTSNRFVLIDNGFYTEDDEESVLHKQGFVVVEQWRKAKQLFNGWWQEKWFCVIEESTP